MAKAAHLSPDLKGLFLFLLLNALLLGGLFAQTGYKPGDVARDFKLKNVDGKMVSMADFPAAKGFVVVFTCNHCPYAKLYEQRIIDLDKKYRAKGFPVIAINPNEATEADDNYANMQARAKQKGYPFPYLSDETQEIAKSYGAKRTPDIYLVEKVDGKYIVKYAGALDDSPQDSGSAQKKYLEQAIDALLAGKPVPTSVTRSVGCSIKWKES